MGNLAPRGHYLQGLMRQKLQWPTILGELIDNCFDAAAKNVTVQFTESMLTIIDDGNGVEDVESLVRLGDHVEGDQTTLGVYGVGCKDAWLSCGNVFEIESVCRGVHKTAKYDAVELIANNWIAPDPVEKASDKKPFTRLRFHLFEDRNIPGSTIIERLEWMFSPALASGRNIVFVRKEKETKLAAAVIPERTGVIRETFLFEGKRVSIDIGMMEKREMQNGPFWLVFGHRVIAATSLGTGDYSAKGIGGCIVLDDQQWKPLLTKNKNDLDCDTTALGEMILQRIETLLMVAKEESDTFESELLLRSVEDMLNGSINNLKQKIGRENRGSGSARGAVQPKHTGRQRKTAKKVSETPLHDVRERLSEQAVPSRGRIRIKESNDSADVLGRFDAIGNTIVVNVNHPFIVAARQQADRLAFFSAVSSILADYQVRNPDGRAVLKYAYTSFAKAVGDLMSSILTEEPVMS